MWKPRIPKAQKDFVKELTEGGENTRAQAKGFAILRHLLDSMKSEDIIDVSPADWFVRGYTTGVFFDEIVKRSSKKEQKYFKKYFAEIEELVKKREQEAK